MGQFSPLVEETLLKFEGEGDAGVNLGQFSPVVEVILSEMEGVRGWGMVGESVEGEGMSQLGMASGSMQIVVPGRRLAGCSSRCLRKVIWKELKMLPFVVSHS